MNASSAIDSKLKLTFCLHILSDFHYTFILTNYNCNYNLQSIVTNLFSILSVGAINNLSWFFNELHYYGNNGREMCCTDAWPPLH